MEIVSEREELETDKVIDGKFGPTDDNYNSMDVHNAEDCIQSPDSSSFERQNMDIQHKEHNLGARRGNIRLESREVYVQCRDHTFKMFSPRHARYRNMYRQYRRRVSVEVSNS